MEKNYHISKGADDIYYILNCGMDYIQNLSLDLETAKIKAKNIIGSEVPVDIWFRKKWLERNKPNQDAHVKSYENYLQKLAFEKDKLDCEARQFVSNINDKVEIELQLTVRFDVETQWGISGVCFLKDVNGNRYKYFGSGKVLKYFKKEGDKHLVSFKIKDHHFEDKYYKVDGVIPYKLNLIKQLKKEGKKNENM